MQTVTHKTETQAKANNSKQSSFGKPTAVPFFQPKLTVNQPGDPYEQEADSVADQVMRMRNGDSPLIQRMTFTPIGSIQRECLPCESEDGQASNYVMRSEEQEEQMVQRDCLECQEDTKKEESASIGPSTSAAKEEQAELNPSTLPGQGEVMRATVAPWSPIQRMCAECAEEEVQRKEAEEEQESEAVQRMEQEATIDPREEEPVQRSCSTCGSEEGPFVQRASLLSPELTCKACRDLPEVQRKEQGATSANTAPPIVEKVLNSNQGRPLDKKVRRLMESRFGMDFSQVRIHTSQQAAESARAIQAKAYTSGLNVVFAEEQYRPETKPGQLLLAHELVHVVQQGGVIRRKEENTGGAGENTGGDACGQYVAENTPQGGTPEGEGAGTEIPENSVEQKVKIEDTQKAGDQAKGGAPTQPQALEQSKEEAPAAAQSTTSPKTTKDDPEYQNIIGDTKKAKSSQEKHADAEEKAAEAEATAENPQAMGQQVAEANKVLGVDEQVNTAEAKPFDRGEFKKEVLKLVKKELEEIQTEADNKEHQNTGGQKLKKAGGQAVADSQGQDKEALANTEKAEGPGKSNQAVLFPEKKVEAVVPENPGKKASIGKVERAIPKPVTDEEVQLDKEHDAESLDRAMEDDKLKEFDAKLSEDQLANSGEPKFAETLDIKKEEQQKLCQVPGQLREEDAKMRAEASDKAKGKMYGAMKNKHGKRQGSFGEVDGGKAETKSKDERLLEDYYKKIEGIYKNVQKEVKKVLKDMDQCVSCIFEKVIDDANDTFKSRVKSRLNDYYGVGITNLSEEDEDAAERWQNKPTQAKIKVLRDRKKNTTSPAAKQQLDAQIKALQGSLKETIVMKIFREEKARFTNTLDTGLDMVAAKIEQGLNAAKALIAKGKEDIQCASNCLPKNLQTQAKERTDDFLQRFNDLEQTVNEKQKELAASMARDYARNVSKLKETFEKIRKEAAMSWWERAWNAIKEIALAVYNLGKLLVKVLIKAVSVIGDILTSPISFVKNLFKAVKQGFSNFVDNLPTHLQNIIFKLVLGVLPAGIQLPKSFDPKGLLDFALQVLGLTKDNIRAQLVKRLGEPVVSKLETTFDLLVLFKKEGFAGLWEHIKEKIGDLKEQVIEMIKDYFKESIIKAAIKFLLSALSPISGFIKACLTLVDVVKFFLKNLANILKLLDSILDSFIDIAKGRLGNAAKRVENALADILLIGLKFLAALVGINLDKISEKVQRLFNAVRNPINRAINWLIDKAMAFAEKTGLLGVVRKGKEKFDQGKEFVMEKGRKVAGKVLGFFGVKSRFKDDKGESHSVYYKETADGITLMVESSPKSIEEFLDFYQDMYSKELENKVKQEHFANIQGLVAKMKADQRRLEKEKGTKAKNTQQELLELKGKVAHKLGLLMKGNRKVGRRIESYLLEGTVGKYGKISNAVGDDMEGDHQPQSALLKWSRKYLKASVIDNWIGSGHSANAYAILLHRRRHALGATYGSAINISDADKAKTRAEPDLHKRREIVVEILKRELDNDADAMIKVYRTNWKNEEVWGDILKYSELETDEEKKELIEEIRGNVVDGEVWMKRQPLKDLLQ